MATTWSASDAMAMTVKPTNTWKLRPAGLVIVAPAIVSKFRTMMGKECERASYTVRLSKTRGTDLYYMPKEMDEQPMVID